MYYEQKAVFDNKLAEIKRHHSRLVVQTEKLQSDNVEVTKLKSVAKKVVGEKSLMQSLVEALIEKVEIFSDNQIEIVWKIKDFMGRVM